jgi:hypothetical protein
MKICNKCGIEKPLAEYYKSNHGKCKKCYNEANKARNKKRYHNDEQYRKQKLEYTKKYINENDYWESWRDNNRDKIKAANQRHKEYKRQWAQDQRQNNIQFRLKENIRSRIYSSLFAKSDSSEDILGCSIKEYIVYLESKFDQNMNWGNYGTYWEIDHIQPVSTFDLTKNNEIKICFNYQNTQPLPVDENRKKGNKYDF